MRINKVINNNIVSAYDADRNEVIVMGKGIGFNAREGEKVSKRKIEKVFKMDNQKSFDEFKALLAELPLEHIQVSSEIITYAKETLQTKLNKSIYITLTDHISFAIERYSKGLNFSNPLLYEIERFYNDEFKVGKYALELIDTRIGIQLPEDEAAAIALHIVNAEYNTQINEAQNITKLMQKILEIVKNHFRMDFNDQTLHYERFITHLKFFAQRIYKEELLNSEDSGLQEMVQQQCAEEFECSKKIAEFVETELKHRLPDEELSYLAIHIKKVRSYENKAKGEKD